jgi:hypothetical protein
MNDNADQLRNALEKARISYHQGNHFNTRYWAQLAIKIDPKNEEPWLWLAAVSSPHASVAYLEKALSINPNSKRARQGMHWAIKRIRLEPIHKSPAKIVTSTSPITNHARVRSASFSLSKSRLKPHLWVGLVLLRLFPVHLSLQPWAFISTLFF